MFLLVGLAFLAILSLTLMMLWGHERISAKRIIPHAKVEECWDGEDRRKHIRFKDKFDVEYNVEKKPHLKNGTGVNISKGGMKLLLDEKLPEGSIVDLKIYIPEKNKIVEVEGEVVWTNDAEEKDSSSKRYFHSGIKFIAIKEPSGTRLCTYISCLESEPPQSD